MSAHGRSDYVRRRLIDDAAAQRMLVRDALEQVGQRPPGGMSIARAQRSGNAAMPIGALIRVDASGDRWTVVGSSHDEFELARREDGAIQRRRASVDGVSRHTFDLFREAQTFDGRRSAELAPGSSANGADTLWNVTSTSEAEIAARGDRARVTVYDGTAWARAETTWDDVTKFSTTWGDVRAQRGAGALQAVATPPDSWEGVINLRRVVGDEYVIVSGVRPERELHNVVATDSQPGRYADLIERDVELAAWMRDRVDAPAWGDGMPLVHFIDDRGTIGNRSAGLFPALPAATRFDGPVRPELVADAEVGSSSGWRRATRQGAELIARHEEFVLAHEAGHTAQMRMWGIRGEGAGTLASKLAAEEHGIVQEAYSDLLGYARTGTTDFGIRNLAELQHGGQTLTALRELGHVTGGLEVHFGTQLLTRPMVRFGAQAGHEAVAEVTGAAMHALRTEQGDTGTATIDIPRAASALHERAAWRFGADTPAVRALREGWQALGVPLRALC